MKESKNTIKSIFRNTNRVVISIVAVVSVVIVGLLGWQTIRLWKELNSPAQVKTPYNEHYQAKEFPGKDAMVKLVSTAPEGVNGASWKASADGKNDLTMTVLPKNCTQIAPSKARLAYKTAQGDGVKAMVMVYGAGQARTQYDAYVNQLKQCGTNVDQKDNMTTADSVALLTRGDMIVSVMSDDNGKLGTVRDWFAKEMDSVLMSTSCIALDEKDEDANRSFYYNPDKYNGFSESTTVKVDDTVLQASVPEVLEVNNMDVNAAFQDPQTQSNVVSVPLSPLPKDMESSLPTAPALPVVAKMPEAPSNTKRVSYQVVDESGPGCGWAWSGQKAPTYDTATIDANKQAVLQNTRNELTNSIKDYNRQVINWSRNTAGSMAFRLKWNQYTGKTNSILDSWRKLNDARDGIQGAWFDYVDAANAWLHWDDNVAKAKMDYEKSLKSCVDDADAEYQKRLQDWTKRKQEFEKSQQDKQKDDTSTDNEAGDKDDTGKDDTKETFNEQPPEKPSTGSVQSSCQASVKRPDILSQQKPSKPVPPVVPDGVTLPSTWPSDPLAGSNGQ